MTSLLPGSLCMTFSPVVRPPSPLLPYGGRRRHHDRDSSPTSQANNTTTITTKCPHRTSNVNALTSKVPIAQTRHPRSSLCPQSIHHTNKATQFVSSDTTIMCNILLGSDIRQNVLSQSRNPKRKKKQQRNEPTSPGRRGWVMGVRCNRQESDSSHLPCFALRGKARASTDNTVMIDRYTGQNARHVGNR